MNKETCCRIWNQLVIPTYEEMERTHGGLLCPECEREVFKTHYDAIVRHAKEQYMLDNEGRLNRHKVAAAIMIAILKTKPIKKVDVVYYQPNVDGYLTAWPLNESLSITVALSILHAFIIARVDYAFSGKPISRQVFSDVIKEDEIIFKDGIPIDKQDREEWEWELYQVRQDGAYNLLSIAHILREIERNCRLRYFYENRDKKATSPASENLRDDVVEILSLDEILGTN